MDNLMLQQAPPEVWQIVLDYSYDFLTKIRLRKVCRDMYIHLRIIDFYHIEDEYLLKLNDEVLQQHPYIKYLFAFDNSNVININHLENLEVLDASWDCGIHSFGMKQLTKLKKLDANGNPRIKNISQLTRLEELRARSTCGISDENIKDLKLKFLDADLNDKITIVV